MNLSFFIPCVPPTTTAQQKGVYAPAKGVVRFFKKKKVQQAENHLAILLKPYAPKKPFTGPLVLCITFRFPWRKGEKKSIREKYSMYPIETRPDIDNIFKGTADVLTLLSFWEDDSQLACVRMEKVYADVTGIEITLSDYVAHTFKTKMN